MQVVVKEPTARAIMTCKEDKKSIPQSTGPSHIITAFRIWRHSKVTLGQDRRAGCAVKTIKMFDIRGKGKQVRQFLY